MPTEVVEGLEKYRSVMIKFAERLTRNPEDAEDLVQEAQLRAFKFQNKFIPGTNLSAWLLHIQKNIHIGRSRRKTAPEQSIDDTYEPHLPKTPSAEGEALQEINDHSVRDEVHRGITALHPRYQAVLLAEMRGLGYEETAQTLQIPKGSVASRLFRSRRILAGRLAHLRDRHIE